MSRSQPLCSSWVTVQRVDVGEKGDAWHTPDPSGAVSICFALMNEPTFRVIRTNGIDMHVAEQGEGPLVVLCHGFPELWYSWRHQLPALARAGYHAVAPDQRGYGGTDQPAAIDDYDIVDLTDDMLGLL